MAAKLTRQLPSPVGVAASSTAVFTLPLNGTYCGIILTFNGGTGLTVARMNKIRLKINGREIFSISGTEMDTINKFLGRAAATATNMYIDFERVKLKSRDAVELTAIGTGMPLQPDNTQPNYNPTPAQSIQLEVDIDPTAVSPTLSGKAVLLPPAPLGIINKRRTFTYSPAAAGVFEVSDIPKGDSIDRIFISHGGILSDVAIDRDNFRYYERTNAENALIQGDGVRVPQTNWHVIDPSATGDGGDYISTLCADFRIRHNITGAGTLKLFVDYLGGLQGN